MLHNKNIAVVVPAYNEEKQIGMVIETMPDFVDRIIFLFSLAMIDGYLGKGLLLIPIAYFREMMIKSNFDFSLCPIFCKFLMPIFC